MRRHFYIKVFVVHRIHLHQLLLKDKINEMLNQSRKFRIFLEERSEEFTGIVGFICSS
jgi:hypothetical protein